MKERLLITTAIGLMLGTGALAQSPNEQPKTNSPATAQSQTNPSSSTTSTSTAPAASSSTAASPSSTPSTQNAQSTTPPSNPGTSTTSTTTTSQSAPNAAGTNNNNAAHPQAQSNQTPANGATTAPSQAQSTQPSNAANQAQTNTTSPENHQTQSAPTGANANNNAGTQPSNNQSNTAQSNTAQPGSSNVNVSANLNESQRTHVSESISRLNAKPVTNVNFSLSVGTVVPRDVHFQTLPAEVVEVVPQYRGYDFIVVRDDIVIVEPSTYKIVDVLPRGGRATAAAPARRKTVISDKDRDVIRKHTRVRTEQRATIGNAASTHVRIGDRLPESVEVQSFPDEVYRESPTLREYRYIERDNRTYVVEPHERTILEEID